MTETAAIYNGIPADVTIPVTFHSALRPPNNARTVWVYGNGYNGHGYYSSENWFIVGQTLPIDGIKRWSELPEVPE